MKRIIFTFIFFICVTFNSFTWGAETEVALPKDAVKTLEKSFNIGPTRSSIEAYETSLPQDRLYAFYKKEMVKLGWRELKQGLFSKDNYMAVLAVAPNRAGNNKTQFSLTTSRIPTKEEILAQRKAKPDKLDFMPVYPGSEQVFLWDTPTGISASYDTKSDIKDVVFFYKSGMLNYNWSLASEEPVATQEIVDCPECQKALGQLPQAAAKSAIQGTSSKASLTFRKAHGESCMIRLYQNLDKTTILVTYNANKKINP